MTSSPARLAGSLPAALLLLFASAVASSAGCATPVDEEAASNADGAVDGEHAAEDDDGLASAGEAITAHAAEGLAPISPPSGRVATRDLAVHAGARIAAGARLLAIRTFLLDGVPSALVVDADSLETSVVRASDLDAATRAATASDSLDASPYAKSLAAVAQGAAANKALDRVAPSAKTGSAAEPFALTVDMCQSKKPWEEALFEWAVSLSDTLGKPVPIGVAMTGGWARAHPTEFDRLVDWTRTGKLAITWINHSSTHPLHCLDASCRRAEFLTAASVDFDAEVLGLEQALLARGLSPSVLFRFPGLVHDAERLAQLGRFSLLPIDANAWIAKGQPLAARSVVLVHGNGNEPPGISGFFRAVQGGPREAALASGRSALVSPLLVAPSPPRPR